MAGAVGCLQRRGDDQKTQSEVPWPLNKPLYTYSTWCTDHLSVWSRLGPLGPPAIVLIHLIIQASLPHSASWDPLSPLALINSTQSPGERWEMMPNCQGSFPRLGERMLPHPWREKP